MGEEKTFSRDIVTNAIEDGIKADIRLLLRHEGYRGTVQLTLSAIDAMASLTLPDAQADVKGDDYVRWAAQYVRIPGEHTPTGDDLYGARCAMLHAYGTESKRARQGRCRQIIWTSEQIPPVRVSPEVPTLMAVSIPHFVTAVFSGIDRYLVDAFSDKVLKARINSRLQKVVMQTAFSQLGTPFTGEE